MTSSRNIKNKLNKNKSKKPLTTGVRASAAFPDEIAPPISIPLHVKVGFIAAGLWVFWPTIQQKTEALIASYTNSTTPML